MQKLLDFDVAIEPLSDGYRTLVVASPVGEAAADFALPFTDQDLEILVLKVVGSVGGFGGRCGGSNRRKDGCSRISGVSFSRLRSLAVSASAWGAAAS